MAIILDFPDLVNQHFYPYLFDESRYLILMGGAGSGKSHFAAQKFIYRSLVDEPHRILILRKTNRSVRRSCFTLMKEYLRDWGIPFQYKDLHITVNNSEMIFTGLDDPEKLKSIEGITSIWMEEATEFTPSDFLQIDLRLRGERPNYKQIIFTFNPIGGKMNWLYQKFFDDTPKNSTVDVSTWRDNQFIDQQYKETITNLKDTTFLAIYDKGEWADIRNAIYSNYEIRAFDIENMLAKSKVYAGLDFGYNDPSVALLIAEYDTDIYICKEIYIRKRTNRQFIKMIQDELPDNIMYYADSAEPDRIAEFNMEGLATLKANKAVKPGIDELRSRNIIIHPDCTYSCTEIPMYSNVEDRDGNVLDVPVDFNNHTCDALRYGVYTSKNNMVQLFT